MKIATYARARVVSVLAIVAGLVALTGLALSAPAAADTYAAPQITSVTIKVAKVAKKDECVHVDVAVVSDAGTPTGSVDLAVNGTPFGKKGLASNGTTSFGISCGGAHGAAYVGGTSTATSAVYTFRTAAQVESTVATAAGLAVGENTLTASFVPTGNWAPSSASAHIVVTAPAAGAVPHGVDAGLAGLVPDSLVGRIAVSGVALTVGAALIFFYRRSVARDLAV